MLKEQICFLNGALLPQSQALVSVNDGGILYGDGLFETMRIYGGQPFLLEQHLQRLQKGADYLELPLPDLKVLIDAVKQVVKANAVEEGSLRLTVTGGDNRRFLWPRSSGNKVTLLITARNTIPYPDHLYQQGYRGCLVSFPRNEASPMIMLKSLNFMENVLGKREAVKQGYNEGIFLNTQGELTEGTTSNLFLFDGKTLMTPSVKCGLLPGITRNVVLRLAQEKMHIPVEERALRHVDLEKAIEAFLTASILEIMPLVQIDGKKIGNGTPGSLSRSLLAQYRIIVR